MPNTTMDGYHAYAIYIMAYNILRKKKANLLRLPEEQGG